MSLKMRIPPLDVTTIPIVTMSLGYGGYHRSASTNYTTSESLDVPDVSAFQKLFRDVFRSQRISIRQIERLVGQIHRLFLIRLNTGSNFILKSHPPSTTRILRHEKHMLHTEFLMLDLLASRIPHLPAPRSHRYDESSTNMLQTPLLLRSFLPGTCLASFSTSVSRDSIDFALGGYMRSIVSMVSTTFGNTAAVIAGTGSHSWPDAFLSLLEGVLRDGEDMLVAIPYDAIRMHAFRHIGLLAEITISRCVPLHFGCEKNVLVELDLNRHDSVTISGLLGWDEVIWGDHLMADCFTNASNAFWSGYGGKQPTGENDRIRGLLYTIYKAVSAVVSHYHRPNRESDELEARRSLMLALRDLNFIEQVFS